MSDAPIYSKSQHIENLLIILERNDMCNLCPANSKDFRVDGISREDWNYMTPGPCKVCQGFLGLEYFNPSHRNNASAACPCYRLGSKQTIRITKQKLEKE